MDKTVAATVLESLRQGTVPIEHVGLFSVGRDEEVRRAVAGLEACHGGVNHLTFVSGPYGSGKTHFLGLVRSIALGKNHAVTHVVLSSVSCPLNRLETVYTSLLAELSTPTCHERSAFRPMLDSWLSATDERLFCDGQAHGRCKHGTEFQACAFGCMRDLIAGQLPVLESLSPEFKLVLTAYFDAWWSHDTDVMQLCEQWLLGMRLRRAERGRICYAASSDEPLDNITNDTALRAFADAARVVQSVGHEGLVIMLDEAETLPSVGYGGRNWAFINLVRLMRRCRQWKRIYCIYATTPYFDHHFGDLMSELVLPRDDLPQDFKDWLAEEFSNSRIELPRPPQPDLVHLALRIRCIAECAHGGKRVPSESWIKRVAAEIIEGLEANSTMRQFVTAFMAKLDDSMLRASKAGG